MDQLELNYRNSRIVFHRTGTGPSVVICFHGYDQHGGFFDFLDQLPGNQYRFYAMDLPFHGLTDWKEGLCFTPGELEEILGLLAEQEGFAPEKIVLMGFSMGGRVALSMYGLHPGKYKKLILLAPDGLRQNFWYWASTQTWPGNRLFRFTMKNPGWFFALFKGLNKLKFVSPSIYKFAHTNIHNPEVRKELYQRWTTMRRFKPRIKAIKKMILQHQTPTELLYGTFDRIIVSSVGDKFRKGIENYCRITLIKSGHQLLQEKHVKEIQKAIES